MDKNNAAALGFALFAPASGMSPDTMREAGHFKTAMDRDAGRARALVKQRIVADAAGVMHVAGMGDTHAGIHLRKIASTPAEYWQQHHFEVADLAADVLTEEAIDQRSQDLHKSAFTPSNVAGGILDITKAGALISALVGISLGAGYFAADRALGGDNTSVQQKEQELQHFRRVGDKLQRRMSSKYGYTPYEANRAYSPEEAAYV